MPNMSFAVNESIALDDLDVGLRSGENELHRHNYGTIIGNLDYE